MVFFLLVITAGCVMLAPGCASAPVWETCEVECVDYANFSCRRALEGGNPAGVVVCTPVGEVVRHAVAWVYSDGHTNFWDAINARELTADELGNVHYRTLGPSRGAYDACPLPGEKK